MHYRANKLDAHGAREWWCRIMCTYRLDEMLFLDETSKDNSALKRPPLHPVLGHGSILQFLLTNRRTFGYSLRGEPALARETCGLRGLRVSALAAFSSKGFTEYWAGR